MRVAVMQPTYLPWLGYFDLMDQVDAWVVLDNVQFVKQSWQQRNRIKTPAGLLLLSLPARVHGRLGQRIADVELRERGFWREHLASIDNYYRRCPHFEAVRAELASVFATSCAEDAEGAPPLRLVDVNLALIEFARRRFGIATPLLRASQLRSAGQRGELVAALCAELGAREYVSPIGARDYLAEDAGAFASRGIALRFHAYEHPVYPQRFPPFAPHAAFVDLLFNCGDEAGAILRAGRRPTLSSDSLVQQAARGLETA